MTMNSDFPNVGKMPCHITDERVLEPTGGDEHRTSVEDYVDGLSDQQWLADLVEAIQTECYVAGSRTEMSPNDQGRAKTLREFRNKFIRGLDGDIGTWVRQWLDDYQCELVRDMQ